MCSLFVARCRAATMRLATTQMQGRRI